MRYGVKGGQLKVLTEEQLYDIHLAILNVLETHGVRIEDNDALKLLHDAGADVDFEKQIARIPEQLVEESARNAPRSIYCAGRNPKNDFVLRDDVNVYGCGGGPLQIYDLETGQRRLAKKADVVNAVKLSDGLPNFDFVMAFACPQGEFPGETIGLHELATMLMNTEKHIVQYSYHGTELAKAQLKMLTTVAGGEKELRRRPLATIYNEPSSPLRFGKEFVQTLVEFAKLRQPGIWAPCPQAGGTSPMTLAGTLVSGTAESLAGNVIMQLTNKGAPFIMGAVPLVLDMKTGLTAYAGAENMLMESAWAQLAHFYRIPLWGTGGVSDSKAFDAQAAIEVAMTLTVATLSGANLVHDLGYLESGIASGYESLVVCDELIDMLSRICRGIKVDDETLAVEAIQNAGHGGHFLGLKHSRKHFATEHLLPKLMDRSAWRSWTERGGKDLRQRAREKAQKIIKEHTANPISEDVRKELESTIAEAEKNLK